VKTLGGWIQERPLTPRDALGWVLRVARGLEPLHELDVAHGRVTAEAVLSEAPACGSSAMLIDADEVKRSYAFYSAMRCKISGASTEDDVWALGVLLYFGVTGAYPFPGEHRRAVRERIEWRPASPLNVYDLSHPRLQSLLDRLFKRDETLRLVTVGQLIDAIVNIDPTLEELPALVFGVATGDEVSAVRREPARSEARAAELERTVDRVTRELDADEEAIVLEHLVDGIARDVPVEPAYFGGGEAPPDPIQRARPASAWLDSQASPSSEARGASRRGGSWLVVGIFAAALMAALLVYAASRNQRTPPSPAPAVQASPAATASTTPSSRPVERRRHGDVSRCVVQLFDDDTFEGTTPRFDDLCSETSPQRAADALKTEIVLGKGGRDTTPAMRVWARLNWYEYALIAAARDRCCTSAPKLKTAVGGAPCFYDDALAALGEAAAWGDDRSFRLAMADYAKAADCLVTTRAERQIAREGRPGDGEAAAFVKALRRMRADTPP
jgi:hypothetical protein